MAILWDYQAGWAASGPAMPSADLEYSLTGQTVHRLLRDRGITADVVHPSADLTAYRLIVVPTLYLVRDEHAAAVAAAAEAGAEVLVTFFSGISDESDHVRLGGYPGPSATCSGCASRSSSPCSPGRRCRCRRAPAGCGARTSPRRRHRSSARMPRAHSRGAPPSPRREVGSGSAWYLSTLPDDQTLAALLEQVTSAAGVAPAADVPPGVEAVRRRGEDGCWLFLANDTSTDQTVAVTGHDLVADRPVGPVVLRPGGVAVVREA